MYIIHFDENEWFAQETYGDITGTSAQNIIIEHLNNGFPPILMSRLDQLKDIPGLEDVEPTIIE